MVTWLLAPAPHSSYYYLEFHDLGQFIKDNILQRFLENLTENIEIELQLADIYCINKVDIAC